MSFAFFIDGRMSDKLTTVEVTAESRHESLVWTGMGHDEGGCLLSFTSADALKVDMVCDNVLTQMPFRLLTVTTTIGLRFDGRSTKCFKVTVRNTPMAADTQSL